MKSETIIKKEMLKNTQPKYASAISGSHAEKGTSSLESRYDSKKVETRKGCGKAITEFNKDMSEEERNYYGEEFNGNR